MAQIILIGIAAGAAAALLFASVASGMLLSIPLFYLSALPIMIAAVGWSHLAGLIAALSASAGLGLALNGYFALAFLVSVGLPAWWLGYLALLARPGADHGNVEWYPPGRLVVWAAIAGTAVVLVALFASSLDLERFRAGLKAALERFLGGRPPEGTGPADWDRLIAFLVLLIPPVAGVIATLTNIGNLWLAGLIVRTSGRLRRPWPAIVEMRFPGMAPLILLGAMVASFLPGVAGAVGSVLAASMLIAYALLGLAVLHAITRGMNARPFVLAGAYVSLFVLGWPAIVLALTGLVDAAIDIRGRFARKQGPPPPATRT